MTIWWGLLSAIVPSGTFIVLLVVLWKILRGVDGLYISVTYTNDRLREISEALQSLAEDAESFNNGIAYQLSKLDVVEVFIGEVFDVFGGPFHFGVPAINHDPRSPSGELPGIDVHGKFQEVYGYGEPRAVLGVICAHELTDNIEPVLSERSELLAAQFHGGA